MSNSIAKKIANHAASSHEDLKVTSFKDEDTGKMGHYIHNKNDEDGNETVKVHHENGEYHVTHEYGSHGNVKKFKSAKDASSYAHKIVGGSGTSMNEETIQQSNINNLVNAIIAGDALETENAFNAAMAEKLVSKLDDMRTNISQNMFASEVNEETNKKPSLGHLAAKHFEHTINAEHGHNFDLTDKQMAYHAKKAHEVKSQIEHHYGAEAAKDTHEHSHAAAYHEEGSVSVPGFHHEFVKKHLGGVNSPEHQKYKTQIDKQDVKMHGDTGVTTHHTED